MNTSYVFLAPGFEEVEALTVIDVMRRAGMDVKTVSITDSRTVAGAHGIAVTADVVYEKTDFITPEWLILPGGMPGATNLSQYAPLNTLLLNQANSGKIAAICASPAVVLAPLGILDGKEATCYPGFEKQMHGAVWLSTALSPPTALRPPFASPWPSWPIRWARAWPRKSAPECSSIPSR